MQKTSKKTKLREALPKSMQHSGPISTRDEHPIQPIEASAHNMDDNILLAAKAALTYKAIELGLSGNGSMLKLCLERISIVEAKRAIIKIPVIRTMDDALEALSLITQACASGAISASDGEGLARLVGVTSAALADVELLRRLEALEESESYEESQGPRSTNWCARTADIPEGTSVHNQCS